MKIFIAGIMQGSHTGAVLHEQEYRQRLRELLETHLAGAEVFDPLAEHRNSLDYDPEQGRRVFMHHNRLSSQVDVLVAFVPEASMGTAIEMWEAYRHGRVVLTISPLEPNWTVRFLSHRVYPDLEAFAAALSAGQVSETIAAAQIRAPLSPSKLSGLTSAF